MGRPFWLLWAGQFISAVGDAFGLLALSWLLYQITGSPVAMGGLQAAMTVPSVLVWLAAGPWLDRVDRRRLLAVLDGVRAFAFAAVALLALTGHVRVWHLFALAILEGTALALFWAAGMAFVPGVVGPEGLARANAWLEAGLSAARLLGPGLAGALVARVGAPWALWVDAGSFLASAAALLLLPVRTPPPESRPEGAEGGYLTRWAEGFRFFGQVPALLIIMLILALANAGNEAGGAVFVPYVRERLGAGPAELGLMESVGSAGYLLGALLAGARGDVPRRRLQMLGALAVSSGAFALLALPGPGQWWLAAACLFVSSGTGPFFNTLSHTIYQSLVPDRLRGRVMSVRLLVGQGIRPLGALCGGILADRVGAPAVFFLGGALPAAVALFGLLLPALRAVDGPECRDPVGARNRAGR